MKFKAPWLENGIEVDLPDMKVEGSLEVAELTKKHVDNFLPFINAIQDESSLRIRVDALASISTAKDKPTDEEVQTAKNVLLLSGEIPSEDFEEFETQCRNTLAKLTNRLIESSKVTARVSIESAPFFMKRSLIEAFYMIKAYYLLKSNGAKKSLRMPFDKEQLSALITDRELAIFTHHSMAKIKKQAEEAPEPAEKQTPDDLKKKW